MSDYFPAVVETERQTPGFSPGSSVQAALRTAIA